MATDKETMDEMHLKGYLSPSVSSPTPYRPTRRYKSPVERRKALAKNLSPRLQEIAALLDRAPQEEIPARHILELMFEELAALSRQIAAAQNDSSGSTPVG